MPQLHQNFRLLPTVKVLGLCWKIEDGPPFFTLLPPEMVFELTLMISPSSHTGATPKPPAAPVTKNIGPTYSPEIQGWDFSWLELLGWLKEGVACNQQLQPTEIPALHFRRICRAGVFGWASRCGPGIVNLCMCTCRISPFIGRRIYASTRRHWSN